MHCFNWFMAGMFLTMSIDCAAQSKAGATLFFMAFFALNIALAIVTHPKKT